MRARLRPEFRNEITLECLPYKYFTYSPGTVYDVDEGFFNANKSFLEALPEEHGESAVPAPEFDRNPLFETSPEYEEVERPPEPASEGEEEQGSDEFLFDAAPDTTVTEEDAKPASGKKRRVKNS